MAQRGTHAIFLQVAKALVSPFDSFEHKHQMEPRQARARMVIDTAGKSVDDRRPMSQESLLDNDGTSASRLRAQSAIIDFASLPRKIAFLPLQSVIRLPRTHCESEFASLHCDAGNHEHFARTGECSAPSEDVAFGRQGASAGVHYRVHAHRDV